MTVISASDLNLTFQTNDGPVHALTDSNLQVAQGDFVSFIGPSGCGRFVPRPSFPAVNEALARGKEMTAPRKVQRDPMEIPSGV